MNDNIEPLYSESSPVLKSSPAIGFLNVLLTIIWWGGWVFLGFFLLLSAYAGLAHLGLDAAAKSFEKISPLMALMSSISVVIVAAVFLIVIKQLRAICKTLVTGDPFVPENARRLRVIWIAVAIGELLRLLSTFLISSFSQSTDGMSVVATDLRIYVWFMVLALIILSEVFREGARLRQDAKLTV